MNTAIAHLPAIYPPARSDLKLELGSDLVRWALRTALRFTGFDPKIVAQAEQSVGRRLGEATLSEDIRYVLDDLDESVLLGIAEVAAIGTHRWLLRLVRAVPVRAGWGHSLGRIATAQIEMASAYIEELEKLLPHQETGRSLATLTTDFREHDAALLEHIYDLNTSTELASALLSARRFSPAMFALGFAIEHPAALPASVVNEVAREFAAAAKNALRLVAAHGDGQVDERVLPRSERLDVAEVEAAHADKVRQYESAPQQATIGE